MRLLLLPLLLAACAQTGTQPDAPAAGGVIPREVVLYRDTVTARMSDGALCTAVRPGGTGPWRSVLAGCPHAWPAAVLRTAPQPRVPLAPAPAEPWVTLNAPGGVLGFAPRG